MGKYAKSLKDSLTVEEFIEDLISEGYNKDEILDTVKGQIVRIEEYEYVLTKPYEYFVGLTVRLEGYGDEYTDIERIEGMDDTYLLQRNSDEAVYCTTNKDTLAYLLSGGRNRLLCVSRRPGDSYVSVTV